MSEIFIAGGGAWGSALALQVLRAGNRVTLGVRSPDHFIPGKIFPRLPGIAIPDDMEIVALDQPAGLAAQSDAVIAVIPLSYLRFYLPQLADSKMLLLCCKGFEHESALLPAELVARHLPHLQTAILSGPNFAHSIAAGLPAASVIAGGSEEMRATLIDTLSTPNFRLYGNDDMIGAAVGGAAKNVAAIAAGAVIGANLGENARAAVITRSLAEITRLATALGGRADTLAGLSGIGDLILTCTGAESRNFSLGLALGTGKTLEQARPKDGSAVEGIATAAAMLKRAHKAGVEMPIAESVADLLAGRATLPDAITRLLTRPRRDE
jgi:glycerol-3-phosphate dehydrogenase (NAD(P)+)